MFSSNSETTYASCDPQLSSLLIIPAYDRREHLEHDATTVISEEVHSMVVLKAAKRRGNMRVYI